MKYYLAVDVGATKTRIALCDENGVLEKVVELTPREGDELTIANLITNTVRQKWERFIENVASIGIGTIGPVDIRRGRVVNTPNLPIRSFQLLEPLVRAFHKPVFVANDAVSSVWGEVHYGVARGRENVVYVTLSTGVGVGVVVDGHLLIGKEGNAHEAGHIVVAYDSDIKCGCGGTGHWEAFAGGANIPRVAKYLARKTGLKTPLSELLDKNIDVTARDVFEYYRRGDELAKIVVETYVRATAAGLASVINTYDPELVILGGGVFLNNTDILLEPIIERVRVNIVTSMPDFAVTSLGDDVGLFGALAIATHTPDTLRKIQEPLIRSLL